MEGMQISSIGSFCWNEACEDYQKVHHGNIIKSGKTDKELQIYRCKTCKKSFRERGRKNRSKPKWSPRSRRSEGCAVQIFAWSLNREYPKGKATVFTAQLVQKSDVYTSERGDTYRLLNGVEIVLDSEEWFEWIGSQKSFYYCCEQGEFSLYLAKRTYRRELKTGGQQSYIVYHWYIYLFSDKKSYRRYIGPTQEMTAERLNKGVEKVLALRDREKNK